MLNFVSIKCILISTFEFCICIFLFFFSFFFSLLHELQKGQNLLFIIHWMSFRGDIIRYMFLTAENNFFFFLIYKYVTQVPNNSPSLVLLQDSVRKNLLEGKARSQLYRN